MTTAPPPIATTPAQRLVAALQLQDISKADLAEQLRSSCDSGHEVVGGLVAELEARRVGVHAFVRLIRERLGDSVIDSMVDALLHQRVSASAVSELQNAMAQQRARRRAEQCGELKAHHE